MREMSAQVLDSMDLERERGITIKAHPVRLNYTAKDGKTYVLNLIDTPGHVDFSYEVSRSLAACEGALLLVDASQGVEAQTLANAYLAVENNLEIIPVINKIDLPSRAARRGAAASSRRSSASTATPRFSPAARTAAAWRRFSKRWCTRVPPPEGDPDAPLKALIFDSWYDSYRGVVIVVRVLEGTLRDGDQGHADEHQAGPRGRIARRVHAEGRCRSSQLGPGEVGFIACGIKVVSDAQIGDTVTDTARPDARAVPRLQGTEADGVRRPLSGREPSVRRAARGAREAAPQRRGVLLRAGNVGRARLRIPLRLPRPAAHGDRAGAPRARIQHGPGHHGAGRAVSRDQDRRRDRRDRQPGEAARDRPHQQDRRAGDHRDDPDAGGVRRRHPAAVPGQARRAEGSSSSRPPIAC